MAEIKNTKKAFFSIILNFLSQKNFWNLSTLNNYLNALGHFRPVQGEQDSEDQRKREKLGFSRFYK